MKNITIINQAESQFLNWFRDGLQHILSDKGYLFTEPTDQDLHLVLNFISTDKARPFRRQAKATFVISIMETFPTAIHENNRCILKEAYPYLVRTLSNHLIYICHYNEQTDVHFITPEQGCYKITFHKGQEETFFADVFQRLEPLACSQLVIDNVFETDLAENLWQGDDTTRELSLSGKKLEKMNLLPAPFPINEYVSDRDMRHLKKLYGIGGLSYGNLSSRHSGHTFWMSASGVNKAELRHVGEDILLIKEFDQVNTAMKISVPPEVQPKRASVDAIEHWMIYTEHPEVGAIVHIHAWIDGVKETEINYPCGTIQLAETVAQLIREEADPAQSIIGLKNHGLTITGRNLQDIFERIEGKIIPQVPMT